MVLIDLKQLRVFHLFERLDIFKGPERFGGHPELPAKVAEADHPLLTLVRIGHQKERIIFCSGCSSAGPLYCRPL